MNIFLTILSGIIIIVYTYYMYHLAKEIIKDYKHYSIKKEKFLIKENRKKVLNYKIDETSNVTCMGCNKCDLTEKQEFYCCYIEDIVDAYGTCNFAKENKC